MATGTSSINTKESNISTAYLKRAAGLITDATGRYIKGVMPNTSSTVSEAKRTVVEVHSAVTQASKEHVLPILKMLKVQPNFKNISNWFLDKSEEYGGIDDGSDLSFDVPGDDTSEIAEEQVSEIGKNADQISQAVVESSGKLAEAQMTATANLMSVTERQMSVIAAGFDKTNETLNSILEILTKNTSAIIESTIAGSSRSDNDRMISSGRFDLSEYKNILKKNINKNPELSTILSFLPMLTDHDQIKDLLTSTSVIGGILDWGINVGMNKFAPKFEKNTKALDKAISDTIITSLTRLGENQDYGVKGTLARLFGIDSSKKEIDTSRPGIELKAVPFDSITKEAITNAIPGYLRKILVAVGGKDIIYDYRTRSFRTKNEIQNEFMETAATTGTLSSATNNVRDALGDGKVANLFYDLMMVDLGSKTNNGKYRDIIESFKNVDDANEYIDYLLKDSKLTESEKKEKRELAKRLSEAVSGMGAIDIGNQVARTNVNRNYKIQQFVDNGNAYETDFSEIRDSDSNDKSVINKNYGTSLNDEKTESTINTVVAERSNLSGINYTNIALYEIFRRLNEGINVFQVGSNNSRNKKYKKFDDKWLPKPFGHKPTTISGEQDGTSSYYGGSGLHDRDKEKENEDEITEDMSKGQRFLRWGKKRGTQFANAMFNGSPEDVKNVFSAIVGDVSHVGKNLVKKGTSRLDNKFGNVSGYVKHKIMGTGYSYTNEDGSEVRIKEGKGALGFITDEFKDMFANAKKSSSDWIKTTLSFFDGPGSKEDDEDSGITSKRKKLLAASIGAFAGAGLLGGPIGLIMGGIAGNALSGKKIGKKINKLLFGHDDEGENATGKATGIISKAAESVISPIKFQLSKTIAFGGAMVQKHIFGPMSDLGRSIGDRIHNHVDSIFDKIKSTAGKVLGKVFGVIGKGVAHIATGIATAGQRLGATVAGKAARGVIGVGTGLVGAIQTRLSNKIAGRRSFHKLKKGEVYALFVGDHYLDPAERDKVKKLEQTSEIPGHEVEWMPEYGRYGIWLNGDIKNELMPRTRDYNKRKRKERNTTINENLKKGGFYGKGGVLGFLGGDYKKWRDQDRLKGMSRRAGLKNAMREERMSPEEIAAANAAEQEKNRKQQEELAKKQQETSEKINENVEKTSRILEEERIPGSSFKVHDMTLEGLMNKLIEISGGEKVNKDSNDNSSKPVTTVDGESAEQEKNVSDFANSAVESIAAIAAPNGMDNAEASISIDAVNEAAKDKPNKKKLSTWLSRLIKHNKETDDEGEDKKGESFISKLISGIGGGLLKFWPLVLGGLTLLSKDFREALLNLGKTILGGLPSILEGAKEVAEELNERGEATTQGAKIVEDPVTHETTRVISSEQHNEDYNQGYFKTAAKQAILSPYSILKNTASSIGQNILADTAKTVASGGVKTTLAARTIKNATPAVISSVASKAMEFGNAYSTSSKLLPGKILDGVKAFKSGTGELQEAALIEGATKKTLLGNTKAKLDPLSGSRTLDSVNNVFNSYNDLWRKTKGGKVASLALGISYDAGFSIGSRYQEMKEHKNFLGSYYDGTTAGGYKTEEGGAKESVVQFASGTVVVAGCKLAAAAVAAAASIPTLPIYIIAGAVALVAGVIVGRLTRWVMSKIKNNTNVTYSVNTNATKLKHVLSEGIDYKSIDPMYIYNGRDADRLLGLNAGMFIDNPEVSFGFFINALSSEYNEAGTKTCAEHIGAEVLLYEFICNLAYQGVPWACYIAGSSKNVNASNDHANDNIWDDYETNGTNGAIIFKQDKVQVTQKKAKDNIKVIMEDIQRSMKERGFGDILWDLDDLEYAYNTGKEVYDDLKNKGILNNKGEVNTKKFKGSYSGGKNNEGWKTLRDLGKRKGIYFVIKCIVFIDAHVDVKDDERWGEINVDNITSLFNDINPDVSINSDTIPGINKSTETLSENNNSNDYDGSTAEINTGIVSVNSNNLTDQVTNGVLSNKDIEDINKQIKYITAGWAYSHPKTLTQWLKNKGSKFYKNLLISDTNIKNDVFVKWKDQKAKNRDIYLGKMREASIKFAEEHGDIFGLSNKINWKAFMDGAGSSGVGLFGSKPSMKDKYGASIVLKNDVSMGPSVGNYITDMYKDYYEDSTNIANPDEVHNILFGSSLHGEALENSSSDDYDESTRGSSLFGRIAKNMWYYPSDEVVNKVGPSSLNTGNSYNLNEYIKSMNLDAPSELPDDVAIGGPESELSMLNDDTGSMVDEEETKEKIPTINGGNPFGSRPFEITSPYGPRDIDEDGKTDEFHKGVDIKPNDGIKTAPDVVSRFNGRISKIVRDVPDSHTGLDQKTDQGGNMVWIDTDNGLRVKNMHFKAGSIPSNLKEGMHVSVGEKLGVMGSTGRSNGPHLHYQIDASPEDENSHINPVMSINKEKDVSNTNINQDTESSDENSTINSFDSWMNQDTSNDEENEDKSGMGLLGSFVNLLSGIGTGFLNAITGVFGNNKNTDNQGNSNINNGINTGSTSGNSLLLTGNCNNEWITIVRDVKKLVADQHPGYSQSGYIYIEYKGKRLKVRTDCTGIICAMLKYYGVMGDNDNLNSTAMLSSNAIKKGFTQAPFPGWDKLVEGDILVVDGHAEIFAMNNGTKHYVYNGGTTEALANPGATGSSKSTYSKIWRCNEEVSSVSNNVSINGPQNGTLGNGDTLMVPDEYGVFQTFEREVRNSSSPTHGWAKASKQGQLRKDAIANGRIKPMNAFGLTNVATVDGRMLVATKENIGNKLPVTIGDHIDIKFKDGTVWNAMVGDHKGSDAPNPWGHQDGKCVSEIIYWDNDNNSGNQHKKVESITKTGGKYQMSDGGYIGGIIDDSEYDIKLPSDNMSSNKPSNDKCIGGETSEIVSPKFVSSPSLKNANKIINTTQNSTYTVDSISRDYRPAQSQPISYDYIQQKNDSLNNDKIAALLSKVLNELQQITGNTGTSAELLGTLNEKDFVDTGLRNTLNSLSTSSTKNRTTSSTRVPTSKSVNRVLNIASP